MDNKHMTEPWLDQEPMESAYKCLRLENQAHVCFLNENAKN